MTVALFVVESRSLSNEITRDQYNNPETICPGDILPKTDTAVCERRLSRNRRLRVPERAEGVHAVLLTALHELGVTDRVGRDDDDCFNHCQL